MVSGWRSEVVGLSPGTIFDLELSKIYIQKLSRWACFVTGKNAKPTSERKIPIMISSAVITVILRTKKQLAFTAQPSLGKKNPPISSSRKKFKYMIGNF